MSKAALFKNILLMCAISFLVSCQSSQKTFKTNLSKKTLPNGVQVLSFKDKSLPFFKVVVRSDKGYAYEPSDALGVTALVSDLLIEGSEKKSKKELIDAFSALGSAFESGVSEDQVAFAAQSLTEDSVTLAELFTEVLTEPKFNNKAILDLKMKTSDQLKQLVDNPGSLSSVAFGQTMFKGHGYERISSGNLDSISKLRKTDLEKRYEQIMKPGGLSVALIGNWNPGAEALILSKLSDLEKDEVAEVSLSRIETPEAVRKTVWFHKKDLKQANVSFGVSAIGRDSVDYEALKVGLFVLGGSFKSRLNKELRIKRALTYGVGAGLDAMFDGGVIKISGSVRHDKVYEFISEAKKIMADVAKNGITKEELEKSKAIIRGQFPRGIETKEKEAAQYFDLLSRGVQGEELYKYLDKVMSLNLDQVNGALRKYIVMGKLNTVILGNKYNIPSKDLARLRAEVKTYKAIKL
jgi:zinc protease